MVYKMTNVGILGLRIKMHEGERMLDSERVRGAKKDGRRR